MMFKLGTQVLFGRLAESRYHANLPVPASSIIVHTSGSSTANFRPRTGQIDAAQMIIIDM